MTQDEDGSASNRESGSVSGKSVVIRLATEKDIPRIVALYRELAIDTSPAESRLNPSLDDYRCVFAQISRMPGYELLVAEYEGVVVGTVVLLIVPNLGHGALSWAMVENMVIGHRYRRRGLGTLLMEYAIKQVREAGCYRLLLSSNKNRKDAHQFYRSLGFDAYGTGFRRYF
jgi:GNAT superfamily N-acetyltransferase